MKYRGLKTILNKIVNNIDFILKNSDSANTSVYLVASELNVIIIVPLLQTSVEESISDNTN